MTPEFRAWPKIPRLNRTVTITEKIDGTNACVIILEDDGYGGSDDGLIIAAQSRTRIITPGKQTDNYGFAAWVEENAHELKYLGPGYHYGEWYGQGIQRNYGLEEKRFALFNTHRDAATLPSCVEQVPVLWQGEDLGSVSTVLHALACDGSVSVPGFMKPEGIVVYHHAAKQNFKVLLEGDAIPKGQA